MKTIHLYYTDTSDSWRSTDDFSTFFNETQWVGVAIRRNESVTFHPSEADARAAAEEDAFREALRAVYASEFNQLRAETTAVREDLRITTEQRDAAAICAMEAAGDAESARDDLLACQCESDRLRVENTSLKANIEDIHDRTHL